MSLADSATECAPMGPDEAEPGPRVARPAPPDSPLAIVYGRICQLREQADKLLQQVQHSAWLRVSEELNDLLQAFRRPRPLELHAAPHVHAVGIYSQQNTDQSVVVRVADRSGPLVLVLCGYESVNWTVERHDGVVIDFVILSGYYEQHVDGLGEDTPVFTSYYGSSSDTYAYAYGRNRSEWNKVETWIQKLAGLPKIHTVQGGYNESGEPFVIGPQNVDWRVQMIADRLVGRSPHRATPATHDAHSSLE